MVRRLWLAAETPKSRFRPSGPASQGGGRRRPVGPALRTGRIAIRVRGCVRPKPGPKSPNEHRMYSVIAIVTVLLCFGRWPPRNESRANSLESLNGAEAGPRSPSDCRLRPRGRSAQLAEIAFHLAETAFHLAETAFHLAETAFHRVQIAAARPLWARVLVAFQATRTGTPGVAAGGRAAALGAGPCLRDRERERS